MSDLNRKLSIMLDVELDRGVSDDEADVIAERLESIARNDLWSELLAGSELGVGVVSIDAEIVAVAGPDGGDEASGDAAPD